ASVSGGFPLAHGTLGAALPMRIGDWVGRDVPLDEDIVEKTDRLGGNLFWLKQTLEGQPIPELLAFPVR
ncbi:MAG: hypothetical protein ACMUIG_06195, partial [Thermoplasmatota archaeon]